MSVVVVTADDGPVMCNSPARPRRWGEKHTPRAGAMPKTEHPFPNTVSGAQKRGSRAPQNTAPGSGIRGQSGSGAQTRPFCCRSARFNQLPRQGYVVCRALNRKPSKSTLTERRLGVQCAHPQVRPSLPVARIGVTPQYSGLEGLASAPGSARRESSGMRVSRQPENQPPPRSPQSGPDARLSPRAHPRGHGIERQPS